jgi:hypothetical protein
MDRQNNCAAGATCDYGVGTHSYHYDANLSFPGRSLAQPARHRTGRPRRSSDRALIGGRGL